MLCFFFQFHQLHRFGALIGIAPSVEIILKRAEVRGLISSEPKTSKEACFTTTSSPVFGTPLKFLTCTLFIRKHCTDYIISVISIRILMFKDILEASIFDFPRKLPLQKTSLFDHAQQEISLTCFALHLGYVLLTCQHAQLAQLHGAFDRYNPEN